MSWLSDRQEPAWRYLNDPNEREDEVLFTHIRAMASRGTAALCGSATARYLVSRTEFMKLRTPPAPWCPNCSEELAKGYMKGGGDPLARIATVGQENKG